MKDLFIAALLPDDVDGIRTDVKDIINSDVNEYREFSIKRYNGNFERATDEFCFQNFLKEYSIAINVFGLHNELNCRGSFNRFIEGCWQMINWHSREKNAL